VRATLSVDESYKADGTHSIFRDVRVWVVYLTMHILSSWFDLGARRIKTNFDTNNKGRTLDPAVSQGPLTAVNGIRSNVSVGICGGEKKHWNIFFLK